MSFLYQCNPKNAYFGWHIILENQNLMKKYTNFLKCKLLPLPQNSLNLRLWKKNTITLCEKCNCIFLSERQHYNSFLVFTLSSDVLLMLNVEKFKSRLGCLLWKGGKIWIWNWNFMKNFASHDLIKLPFVKLETCKMFFLLD